jgi:hypothetical protein
VIKSREIAREAERVLRWFGFTYEVVMVRARAVMNGDGAVSVA